MELNEEQVKEIGLSEDQVTKVQELTNTHEAELQKGWDGKANEQAEGILQGAFNLAVDKMGIEGIQREQGEKYADALMRTTPLFIDSALAKEKQTLSQKQQELDEKIKNGDGDAALKQELKEANESLDGFKQKAAEYDKWKEADYKGKFEQTSEKLTGMKLQVAFSTVKPNFPDTVNEYEAKAKWKEFKDNIISTHNIEINDDGEAIAIDKANEYKKTKLSELVKTNETISSLSKGREVTGLGSGKSNIKVEGVPFNVPENATPTERQKAITDYMQSEGWKITDTGYSEKWSEFNSKLIAGKNPKK